jgi:hypothetical protein
VHLLNHGSDSALTKKTRIGAAHHGKVGESEALSVVGLGIKK